MAEKTRININNSTIDQLITVPGIGPALAKRVIDNRPYTQVNDLIRVQGINTNLINRLLPNITVDSIDDELVMDVHIATANEDVSGGAFETVETEVFAPEEMTPQELDSESNFDQPDLDETRFPDVHKKQIDEVFQENEFKGTAESPKSSGTSFKDQHNKSSGVLKEEIKNETYSKNFGNSAVSIDTKSSNDQLKNNDLVTRSQLWWSVAGTAILTVFLTILITLGILAILNGGLQYASIEKAYSLESSIITMGDRTDAIQVQINGIRDRLDTLETVAARVTKLEQTSQELQTAVAETKNALDTMSVTINEMQQQIDFLQVAAQKSQDFRNGLLDLLINIEGLPVSEGK